MVSRDDKKPRILLRDRKPPDSYQFSDRANATVKTTIAHTATMAMFIATLTGTASFVLPEIEIVAMTPAMARSAPSTPFIKLMPWITRNT